MERAVSFLGLLVLLGIAYAFSKHRSEVRPRTVIWGVSLQLLFAVIILKEGTPSFVAMFLLVSLVVLYVFEGELKNALGTIGAAGAAVGAGAALVAGSYFLAPAGVSTVLLVLAVAVWLFGLFGKRATYARFGFVAILVLGLGLLWSRGVDGRGIFTVLSDKVAAFLALSSSGAEFVFGNLALNEYFDPESEFWPGFGFQFAFAILPTIIFFSAFMSVLYHLGMVQVVVSALARFMRWTMGTSGSETLSCSANVFVGQTEAPFLVKPFLEGMTESELHAIMVGGFATVAGGVLAGYVQMGVDPGHLIAASVMSAPAALVMAKLLLPETEESVTAGDVEIPDVKSSDNLVGAAATGTTDGLHLALNVGAMLIAFIALIAVVDVLLGYFDGLIDGRLLGGALIEGSTEYAGFFPGSMKTLFGTLLAPLAFIMGVPWADAREVGNLLGIKVSVNEFVAYGFLAEKINAGVLSPRASIIATYALCGFANFSSIGIQIGGIGSLAPDRHPALAKVAVRAMCGGALASWMTATVAGMLL